MVVPARVLVVGAGPTGISAAFLLAEAGSEVTVVERLEQPYSTDRSRAFSYSVSQHGMPTMERIGMDAALKENGVPFSSRFVVYKAGVGPFNMRSLFNFDLKLPASSSRCVMSLVNASFGMLRKLCIGYNSSAATTKSTPNTFWISRCKLLHMMLRHVCKQGLVDIRLGVSAGDVTYSKNMATIQLLGIDGENLGVIHADLVLGCDGLRSTVRRQLNEMTRTGSKAIESRNGFEYVNMSKSNNDIFYKSLSFGISPKFPPLSDDSEHHVTKPHETVWLSNQSTYSFSTSPEKYFVLLPSSIDPNYERYGTIVDSSNSPLWKLKKVDEAYDLLQGYFPQIDFRKIMIQEDMAKFVEAPPGRFAEITKCMSIGGWCGEKVGVVLLGDAAKCFPPDLGQGLNSSLEDVAVFVDALRDASNIREAVQLYEMRREADLNALCRISKIGFAPFARSIRFEYYSKKANFQMRIILNKMVPRFFHPPVTVLMGKMSYSEALKLADETTARLHAISAFALGIGLAYALTMFKT